VPIVQKPGKRYRYDSEYKRNGTANLFVMVDANRSWRKVKVTDRRANQDFPSACAICRGDYPTPTRSRRDGNLSTHTAQLSIRPSPRRGASDLATLGVPLHTPSASCSTWPRSRSASCADNVLTAGSIIATCSKLRSGLGTPRTESGAQIRWMFSTDQAE